MSIHAEDDGKKILVGKFGPRCQVIAIEEITLEDAEQLAAELDDAIAKVKALTEQQLVEVKDFLGMMVHATKTGRLP